MAFTPTSISVGQTSTINFTVSNTNAAALNGVAFTDTLPAGMTIAPSGLSGSCGGGTITAVDGTDEVNLSGATIPASGSCTFTRRVVTTTAWRLGQHHVGDLVVERRQRRRGERDPAPRGSTRRRSRWRIAARRSRQLDDDDDADDHQPGEQPGDAARRRGQRHAAVGPQGRQHANISSSCGGHGDGGRRLVDGQRLRRDARPRRLVHDPRRREGCHVGTQTNTTGNVSATESGNGATANAVADRRAGADAGDDRSPRLDHRRPDVDRQLHRRQHERRARSTASRSPTRFRPG